jgi:uncharacterized surface protein with fasciclin (FAS1) repeats
VATAAFSRAVRDPQDALILTIDQPERRRCDIGQFHPTTVLSLPSAHTRFMKNLIDAAMEAGNFKSLLSAFKSASLIDMLRSPGQATIFAPTDAAFKRLPSGSLDALFKDARTLKPILCNQLMGGANAANDIRAALA